MRRVFIVVMNGAPKSGKTEIQNRAVSLARCDAIDASIEIVSSVEVPYKVLRMLGWNGVKDDMFRADMAAVKQMYIRHCNGPVTDLIRLALDRATEEGDGDHIIFSDMREASEIKKVLKLAEALNIVGVQCKTVMVRRPIMEREVHGNDSDDAVVRTMESIKYDIIVDNSGPIDEIQKITFEMIDKILGGNGNGDKGYAGTGTGDGREAGTSHGTGQAIIQTAECC